jgi:hypothetical protein
MRFFKSGIDLSKIAKAIDGLNLMIKEITTRIDRAYEYSEFKDEICVLAFIARRDIIDLIEENNWSMDIKIMVSSFDERRITLISGHSQTVVQIQQIADNIGFHDIVEEIMNKGNSYYYLEKLIAQELTNTNK